VQWILVAQLVEERPGRAALEEVKIVKIVSPNGGVR
jgi:hypothetical protein